MMGSNSTERSRIVTPTPSRGAGVPPARQALICTAALSPTPTPPLYESEPATYEADRIVDSETSALYPVARKIYEGVLADDPGNDCAARGLARLGSLEKSAADGQKSPVETAAGDWQKQQKRLLGRLGRSGGVAAAVFILLLVIARLATPWFVRPTTRVHRSVRWIVWVVGLLMVLAASVTPVVATASGVARRASQWWSGCP